MPIVVFLSRWLETLLNAPSMEMFAVTVKFNGVFMVSLEVENTFRYLTAQRAFADAPHQCQCKPDMFNSVAMSDVARGGRNLPAGRSWRAR
jgi:hypothetical protein